MHALRAVTSDKTNEILILTCSVFEFFKKDIDEIEFVKWNELKHEREVHELARACGKDWSEEVRDRVKEIGLLVAQLTGKQLNHYAWRHFNQDLKDISSNYFDQITAWKQNIQKFEQKNQDRLSQIRNLSLILCEEDRQTLSQIAEW
jgi:hypothetical protein